MRRTWLLLLVLAACKTGDDGDFPINPGGGPGTGSTLDASAGNGDGTASGLIDGQVCVITDLRTLDCGDADGIVVTLGNETVAVTNDGKFSVEPPTVANPVWRASGVPIVTSVVPFGGSTIIPAIGDIDYLDIQGSNGIVGGQAQQGAIVARIVRNNLPLAGATATLTPSPQYAMKYDGPTALAWTELATASAGIVWVNGADLGTVSLRITPAVGTPVTKLVLVEDQSITFVTINVP